MILGYIFGIATEEMQTEQQALNITLHGTNYSTDELEPRPSGEIGGSCFFGELTWSNHRSLKKRWLTSPTVVMRRAL